MAALLKSGYQWYRYMMDELSDPRTNDLPLVGSGPLPVTLIIISYYYFIKHLGPRIMKDRKPFEINKLIQVYDLMQIFLCGRLFYRGITELYVFGPYSIFCEPIDFTNSKLGLLALDATYQYFLIKLLDLLETVFFVLRKKDVQASFLHLFHHCIMVVAAWACCKFFAGGNTIFYGWINCLVHFCMYIYYFLVNYNPENRKKIWWKKHVTQLQLLQFLAGTLHCIFPFFMDCGFPRLVSILLFPNAFMFIALFGDFYVKEYGSKHVQNREPEVLITRTKMDRKRA